LLRAKSKELLDKVFSVLILFTSAGTLLCCALPAAIAAILGTSALFTVIDGIPFLVTLSDHKEWIFALSGLLIGINVYHLWFSKNAGEEVCPIDQKDACRDSKRFAKIVTIISAIVVAIGAVTAF